MSTFNNTVKFDTASITKLNGENYRVWRMILTSLFKSHNLMEIVNETTPRPEIAGASQDQWDQGNNDAFSMMLLTMTDNEVEGVSGCVTAPEMWKQLSSKYPIDNKEVEHALWEKFNCTMPGPEKSSVQALIEIRNSAAQLRSMGVTVSRDMEVARMVTRLDDDKYREFQVYWRSVDVSRQTSAYLLSRLKKWELEAEEFERAKSDENSKALAELKNRTKCHICKQTGHWKSECPSKHKNVNTKVGYAFGAYTNVPSDNEWINSSGASRHYCGRLEWFYEYEKYSKPKPVIMSNNSNMNVVGVGKVKVEAFIDNRWTQIELHNVEHVPGGANLFSENVLLKKGFGVRKDQGGDIIYYKNGKSSIQAKSRDGLQIMNFRPIVNRAIMNMTCVPAW